MRAKCRLLSRSDVEEEEEDDDDDDSPLQNLDAPQDGVVMRWAMPNVTLVQQGLARATAQIKAATSLFERTADSKLELLKQELRLAQDELERAKEEAITRFGNEKEELKASVAVATSAIEKLTEIKKAAGSFAESGGSFRGRALPTTARSSALCARDTSVWFLILRGRRSGGARGVPSYWRMVARTCRTVLAGCGVC